MGPCPHQGHQRVYISCLKKKVLNANIINSPPVTEMTVIKSSLSRLHYANKFTFTAEGWNIPISTDDEFSRTGKSSLDNSTTMKTSVSLTVFEGFLTPRDRQLPKPTEVATMQESLVSYSSLLRSLLFLQGWPPSVGRFDIPKRTAKDLYWNSWCPSSCSLCDTCQKFKFSQYRHKIQPYLHRSGPNTISMTTTWFFLLNILYILSKCIGNACN